MKDIKSEEEISLKALYSRFKGRITFTWMVVVGEAVIFLLFPLVIGFAIDSLLKKEFWGLLFLIGLGLISLVVGTARRFYDTRIYSKIYTVISPEFVEREKEKETSMSVVSTRTYLITEFVEFFENSFPELINSFIGLFGTFVIILFLNFNVFLLSLICSVFIVIVYLASNKRTYRFNKGYNDELEKNYAVLSTENKENIKKHFLNIQKWNIKLSDLETFNFSLIWLLLIFLLCFSVFIVINDGITTYGTVFSIIMYVFNYIESVIVVPYYYQQSVRLNEISTRIN